MDSTGIVQDAEEGGSLSWPRKLNAIFKTVRNLLMTSLRVCLSKTNPLLGTNLHGEL